MDPGLEGIVKGSDAVGRHEEDAGVLLKSAQEDGHQRVALHVVKRAALQKDVCFVNEEDGFPGRGKVQRTAESLVELGGIGAEIAGGNNVERTTGKLGHAFGRECFADAGGPVQYEDEALSFAHDNVVEPGFRVAYALRMLGDQRLDKFLLMIGQDKLFEAPGVPINDQHILNMKVQELLLGEGKAANHGREQAGTSHR